MVWYWSFEHDSVWCINDDGTRSGKSLDDAEIVAWLAEGNTPEPWSASE